MKRLRALLRCVKYSKDFHGVIPYPIHDHVGQSCDDDLSRILKVASTPRLGKTLKAFARLSDSFEYTPGSRGIILRNVLIDPIKLR